MITWRLAELLEERGWTAYRLAQETGFSMPRAYGLAAKGAKFSSYKDETLDRLCTALGCTPGELLVWTPNKKRSSK